MTFKIFFKKMMCRSCVYFTINMLIYIAISALVNVGDSELLLDAGRTILFFVFSLLVALANSLFLLSKPNGALRILVHYLICIFAFYACFMLPINMKASGVLIGMVIFTLVYAVIYGLDLLIRSRYRTKLEQTQAYQKQFKKKQ